MDLHTNCLFPSFRRFMEFHITCLVGSVIPVPYGLAHHLLISVMLVPHRRLCSSRHPRAPWTCISPAYFCHPSALWTCTSPACFRHPGASWRFTSPTLFLPSSHCLLDLHITCLFPNPGASWSLTSLALFLTSFQCPMDLHITCSVSVTPVPNGGSHQPLMFCRLGAPVSLTSPDHFLSSRSPFGAIHYFPTSSLYNNAISVSNARKHVQCVR